MAKEMSFNMNVSTFELPELIEVGKTYRAKTGQVVCVTRLDVTVNFKGETETSVSYIYIDPAAGTAGRERNRISVFIGMLT